MLFCLLVLISLCIPRTTTLPELALRRSAGVGLPRSKQSGPSIPLGLSNVPTLGLYQVDISVGTPGQTIALDVDVGSSDTWLFAADATCPACLGGSYDPSKSSSYALVNEGGFGVLYADNTAVTGDYISEVVSLGKLAVRNATLGLATNVTSWTPSPAIMGLGFETEEAIVSHGGSPYPGLLRLMVEQRLISTRSYSMWLNEKESTSGVLLFGGYDRSKYDGELALVPITADQSGTYTQFTIPWTSLSLSNGMTSTMLTSSPFNLSALLDSGTSFTYVPQGLYSQVASQFGVYTNDTLQQTLAPCDIGEGSLNFGFGSSRSRASISVPLSELLPPAFDLESTEPVLLPNGDQACAFGLAPTDENNIVFGDTFLRSAYVVFMLDAKQIAMAQSRFNSTGASDVVEIQPGPSPLGSSSVAVPTSFITTGSVTTAHPSSGAPKITSGCLAFTRPPRIVVTTISTLALIIIIHV